MGSQHAGGHESSRFAAAAAQHGHLPAAAGQLMGHRQPHQSPSQDHDGIVGHCPLVVQTPDLNDVVP